MHSGPVPGDYVGKPQPVVERCRRCKRTDTVTEQCWESSDGAYEDYEYHCTACGHRWWVEGADA